MVARIVSLLYREVRSLHGAAYLLATFAIFSQLLALLRDRLLAHHFGAGETLDLYYAAFRVPDLIFVATASLVSVYVLIPFLEERLRRGDVRVFLSSVFSFFAVLMLGVGAAAFIAAPYLMPVLFPGFGSDAYDTLVLLTRILLVQPFFLGLSSLLASVTQVYQKFVLYAVSPILYNAGIIAGILLLQEPLGILGVALGVILGAIAHVGIQVPFIMRERLLPRPSVPRLRDVWPVVTTSLPRALALSMQHVMLLAFTSLASVFAAGSIAVFTLAYNLQSVPLAIIGMSYSVAAFPTLAKYFTSGEREKFVTQVVAATRHILFWSLPAIALFVVLRAQIVRVILGTGEFDWTDTRLTAAALALFVISLAAQALVLLFVRGFYAAGNTRVPLIVALGTAGFAVALAYALAAAYDAYPALQAFFAVLLRGTDAPGMIVLVLPLAFSAAFIGQAFVLYLLFRRAYRGITHRIAPALIKSGLAALIVGIASYEWLWVLELVFRPTDTFWSILGQGFFAGVIGIVAGVAALVLLRSQELSEVWEAVRRKMWQRPVIISE